MNNIERVSARRNMARVLTLLALIAGSLLASAAPSLELPEAERLALADDPGVRAVERRRDATLERSVAAATLPEPRLKFGAMALPVDTFDLDQEPMTQLQLGLVQQFPRGGTLGLQRTQLEAEAARHDELARDARADVRLGVREAWIEGVLQRRVLAILEDSRRVLKDLGALTQDYYATGRALQQDVHRTELELARLDERILRTRQAEEASRANLSRWVGDRAVDVDSDDWPVIELRAVEPGPGHPRLDAAARAVSVAETGVAIAREQYKPGFSVEVSYGDRSGQGPTGAARPDFLSAMVMVDLPVFRDRRQDRELAAARSAEEAARLERDALARKLIAAWSSKRAELARTEERLALFEGTLLPEAQDNTAVTLDAFSASVGDMSDLLRAQLTELDVAIEAERTRAEELRLRAQLAWLEGEGP